MTLARTPLKRGSRKPRPQISETTQHVVLTRWGGLGCMCGCGREVQPWNPACWHHIFPKAKYEHLSDHPDNLVLIAVDCHASHENASCRLPRKITRHAALLAMGNPSMEAYLRSRYGRDDA